MFLAWEQAHRPLGQTEELGNRHGNLVVSQMSAGEWIVH